MSNPYLCPRCKTNRTRFHKIEQRAEPVKLDPQTGTVTQTLEEASLDVFHMNYGGPSMRVQCGACGLNELEEMFVAYAKRN
ncbi:hypothetical protein [Shouchella shacheensis]|uniref:hypothetical protein n=1 Tax=Shouchella shacheensis TaxID=1649580 RepID=UPI00074032DD|nr:hypothetical protein [Shouchella shacheensis]